MMKMICELSKIIICNLRVFVRIKQVFYKYRKEDIINDILIERIKNESGYSLVTEI